MDVKNFFVEMLICTIEAVDIILIYLTLIQKLYYFKKEKLKIVLFVLIYAIFSSWISISVPTVYHTFFIMVLVVMVLSMLTSTKIKVSFIGVLAYHIYFIVFELIVIVLASNISGINLFNAEELQRIRLPFAVSVKIAEGLLFMATVGRSDKYTLNLSDSDINDGNIAYWALNMMLVGLVIISVNFINSNRVNMLLYNILLFLLFVFFLIIGIINYKKMLELMNIKHKYQVKEEYINNLEAIMDIIRREKHDFSNHINTVYAMCVLNKPDTTEKIKNYLKNSIANLNSSYKFCDTGNTYIDGLIAVKSNYAFENNICLDVDFESSLEAVDINDNDLVAIISNIIDNAFQAVLKDTRERKKVVSLYGYIENNKYNLSIANNGPMIPEENRTRIFEKGFSTKIDNKKDHGFGLFIVERLVKKNGGDITFFSSEEETEFLIILKLKKGYYEKNS
ncbi:sensor histidine kinase [Clostridium thermopalmarium]|uniref:Sensor histidine kinase DpiB n=1 Tax=Clostridium thermopalmarium DSM 5974 TaxID=1121340 RepID=A0A2T0AZT2_9CLOT|nr:ATP-binding protein [Clostridium thermopalmarium]PRR76735.1 Sensor histidine kinase DpiB [Clostridium thermopalmarium DSM 5974]PVZ23070.1 sensor kinase SpoOB-type protein [Clostridium thermopalmarium DSM 5974]